jgi:multicomponent Na+:H+ antiporter subunit D
MDILTGSATALVMMPLLAAVLSFLLGSRFSSGLFLLTLLVLLSSLYPLTQGVSQQGVLIFKLGHWGMPLGIEWRIDGLSLFMLWLSVLIGSAISLYAWSYFNQYQDKHKTELFWPLWLLLWSGLNGLFLSADIFNLYVTLEILTLAAVPLIVLSGGLTAMQAGMRYLIVALLASALYLLGVALLYAAYGTLDLYSLSERIELTPLTMTAIMLLILGLLTKSALFPLHFWLPPAHAGAPAPVSALLSALVVKATLYLLIRLWLYLVPEIVLPSVGFLLGLLGAMAIIWGSLQALRQTRLKLIIAYSTVAQLGYMFLLFPLVLDFSSPVSLMAWQGGLYQMLTHGFAKAALFMAAGNLLYALKTDELEELKGRMQAYPLTLFALALAGISIMGMPPSGGFVAKWLLLNAAFSSAQWWLVAVILIGGLLSAGYMFRVLRYAFVNPNLNSLKLESLKTLPRTMELLPLILAIMSIVLGFISYQPLAIVGIGSPFATGSVTP